MVEFRWQRRRKDRTPIIRDIDIIEFTEDVLRDYKPKLLDTPGKLDPENFIERYLGATIDYQDIYYGKGESPIAGATIFNRDRVAVFDREYNRVKEILVDPDTIILDNSVLDSKYPGFAEFTEMHEAGHFQMHPDVYKRSEDQIDFFSLGLMERSNTVNGVMCKRSLIGRTDVTLVTDEDFREHQANTYAASMLMPRRTFIPHVYEQNLIDGYGSGIHVIMPGYDAEGEAKLKKLIARTARLYGVSKSAVRVNMEKYGLLTTARDFTQARNRLAMYSRW